MSELQEKLLEIKRQKDTYILPENIKKDITVYGVTGTLDVDGILKFYDETEMKEYTGAEDNQIAAIIDMSDWWDTESNTFYDTIISVPDNNLRIDPFDGNTNFHSITNFYDENDTVIGTFDATYNKLVADLTLEVESISYRYIIWWERVEQREEWAVGGSWNRTKYVRIENGEEVDVEDDYISLTTAIKYNWYSGDEGAYDITSSFIEKPIAKYLEFYIYKWGNWERVGKQGFPMLFKNLWLWENYRDNLDINTMQGEEIAVVFDNEYTKMLEQEALVGASFPYWINIDAPFSDNPNDTFTYEGRDEQNNLCSTVTISNTDVTINIIDLEDYDEGTRSYRITYEYDSENDAFIRQEFVHIEDGEEFDDDSPDDNVWFWKDITWTLTSQVEPDYYIVGQFVQLPSTPVYIDTYEFIYDDNPHWISLSQPRDVVKRFYTVEQMQEDPNPQEGDLAVVYREEIQPVTEESEFNSCVFPNEVVLDEAFIDSIYGRFRNTGGSYFDADVELSSSRFIFNSWGESSEIGVQYTSQDGITYTRIDGGEELQEFGVTIKYQPIQPWNDVFGNFMKIGGNYFDGLYEYGLYTDTNRFKPVMREDIILDGLTVTWNGVYKNELIEKNALISIANKIKEDIGSGWIKTIYACLKDNKWNIFLPQTQYESAYGMGISSITCINNNGVLTPVGIGDNQAYTTSGSGYTNPPRRFEVDLVNQTYVDKGIISVTEYQGESYYFSYANLLPDSIMYALNLSTGAVTKGPNVIVYLDTTSHYISSPGYETNYTYNKYLIASTQLDTTRDYVYEKTFYGKNGVENGNLSNNVSSTLDDNNVYIYSLLQSKYDKLTPLVITEKSDIDTNIISIPSKSDGTCLIDISNVSDINALFSDCKKLKIINNLDISNFTTLESLFIHCKQLEYVTLTNTSHITNFAKLFAYTNIVNAPEMDTSSATTMVGMFEECTSLVNIPVYDTSQVTSFMQTFNDCNSLIDAPALNTASATIFKNMFIFCRNLVNVPVYNTSLATDMQNMFNSCTKLSQNSLNNILAMCTNATNITSNKTLKYIGLTQEQAQICTTLSNYSAFTAAGWTTGY